MIDLKFLRERPDEVREGVRKKRLRCDIDAVLEADARRRELIAAVESRRAQLKKANAEMAALEKGSPAFRDKVGELKTLSAASKEREAELREVEERWSQLVMSIPNLPHESVPEGDGESDNVEYSRWGDLPAEEPHRLPHYEIGGIERILDLERGSKVSGTGFPFLVGEGARLARCLTGFFIEEATRAGYEETAVPLLVNAPSAEATGQLPDKEGQMYQTVEDDLYAIPTAEVPLTNFYRDEILDEAALPVRRCAASACFRREAGSHGKLTRGLNRVHQFDKVELVEWTKPEASYETLEGLREHAEGLLRKLELPYRVLLMCSGDLGFTQTKKYDLEVWAAGQRRWLEVSSCSNFEAFQARRAKIRFRATATGRVEAVHTLNGSGLAVPRVFVAIVENGLQPDGRIRLPEVLAPLMGEDAIDLKA